jgi:hypothetical protein
MVLVVTALTPVLRGWKGRKAGVNDDHDQALIGAERSRVGIRLGLVFLASRMTTRERVGGNSSGAGSGIIAVVEFGVGKGKSDTAI